MAASLILLAVTSDRLICAGAADRIGRIDGIVMVALYIALMRFTIRTTKRPEAVPPMPAPKSRRPSGWRSS